MRNGLIRDYPSPSLDCGANSSFNGKFGFLLRKIISHLRLKDLLLIPKLDAILPVPELEACPKIHLIPKEVGSVVVRRL